MREALVPIRSSFGEQYVVERVLGQGGMATVYLAEDTKHRRKVAIKVLRPELAASLGGERFLREIGIVAQLNHPYIVPLIDSGESEGLLYYVSPFVPGGSLRDRLDRDGRLPIADALRIASDVGEALDFAHRSRLVHRDVKPENILFADGHAVLADFGIARQPSADRVTLTDPGLVLGTPEYMSPEQASGEQDLGAQSDVYSLACVVYEMLSGERPIIGDSPRATMAKHVTTMPRSVRSLRPDVPAAIDRALMRALAKDPAARQRSIAELVADLRDRAIVAPRRDGAWQLSVAVLPFVNASPDPDNEYLSDGITDEIIDSLAKVRGLRVASRTSVFALKGKPNDVRAIGATLGASVVLEGTVRRSGGMLRITAQLTSTDDGRLLWSQRYDRPVQDVFAIQDEIAQTIVNTLRATWFADLAEPAPTHHTENLVAYGLYLKGRYAWNSRTQEGVADAIRYFEQAVAADPSYAAAYTGLADSYALHVDYRSVPVTEGFEHAKAYARKALAIDDTLAEAHASLAWSLFVYDWDFVAADREFRRAIELDPRYATAHQWFAFLLTARGRHEEALAEALTAHELDPASVSALRSVGWQHFYARRFDTARRHLLRAIEMNPTAEETYRVLGLVLTHLGDHAEAERVLREAVEMRGSGTYTVSTLGYALARAGKRDEARVLLGRLQEEAKRDYVSPVAFAVLLIALGDRARAMDYAEQALEEHRGWPVYFAVNPVLDPLRGDPRFEAVVRRVGARSGS